MAQTNLKDVFQHYAGLTGPDEILPLMAEFNKLKPSDQKVFARQVEDIFTEEVENGPYTQEDLQQLEHDIASVAENKQDAVEADNLKAEAQSLCLTFAMLSALSQTPGYKSAPLVQHVLRQYQQTSSEQRQDILTLTTILADARARFFETQPSGAVQPQKSNRSPYGNGI